MQEYKSLVAANWVDFVNDLKQAVKEGFEHPLNVKYEHSFFKSVVLKQKNDEFVVKLKTLTGEEQDVLSEVKELNAFSGSKKEEAIKELPVVEQKQEDVKVVVEKPKTKRRAAKSNIGKK